MSGDKRTKIMVPHEGQNLRKSGELPSLEKASVVVVKNPVYSFRIV